MTKKIKVETLVDASVEKIWEYWTSPEHIKNWYFSSSNWCAPNAKNNLHVGGRFLIRMESKDGVEGLDFEGTYTLIKKYKKIAYQIDDGRKVKIEFKTMKDSSKIIETFDVENINSIEMQEEGWQAILNNFKQYVNLEQKNTQPLG